MEFLTEQVEDIVRCMKCGNCMSACPVFAVTGREAMLARGRIQLLKAVMNGRLELTDGLRDVLFTCLNCDACSLSCPPGIRVDELMKAAKAELLRLGKPLPEPQDLLKPGVAYKELQMRIEFVRSFVESMRGLTDHHQIALSAAVRARYYEDALAEGQDWADWCADGLIDICCPMSYTLSFGAFAQWMARHRRLTGEGDVTWLAGIGLKSSAGELPLDEAERQICFARRADADGIALFSAAALDDAALELLGEIAAL